MNEFNWNGEDFINVVTEISGKCLSKNELNKVAEIITQNNIHIDNLLTLMCSVSFALNKMGIKSYKKAYPQEYSSIYIYPPYDINKWLHAMKDIYTKASSGLDKGSAFDVITSSWNKMEKKDFKYWLSFYEQDIHKKYVTAQLNQMDDQPGGYFLPKHDLKSNLPSPIGPNMDDFDIPVKVDSQDEKKKLIEDQRNKITGRLNSAEKLLCSYEGRIFAGPEFNNMLESLHNLKRQVQVANKRSVSSTLFEDLIHKNANLLSLNGFKKSASFLSKVADGDVPEPPKNIPLPPQVSTIVPPEAEVEDKPYKKFLDGLKLDNNDGDDGDADLVVTAQIAPPVAPKASPVLPTKEPEVPVSDVSIQKTDNTVKPENPSEVTLADDRIERALDSVTIEDAIKRLESLSNIFKTREIARQLSLVDLILDKLGIGSYFPSLGESIRSSLESNSYCSTRVEDILSRLRGSLGEKSSAPKVDLEGNNSKNESPEMMELRNSLDEKQKLEQARKEKRKEESNAETDRKSQPAVTNVPEQLAAPTKVETSPKQPAQIR